MGQTEKFDLVSALAGLPDYPQPTCIQGAAMHTVKIGTSILRFVSDGAMTLPFRALCPDVSDSDAKDVFGLDQVPKWGRGEITSAILDIDGAVVLIDAGAGQNWQSGAGRLLDHLAANAIAPETVTHLVLTHLHPDHAWGALSSFGAPVFANAKVFVGRAEAAFWSKPGLADRVAPAFRNTVEHANAVLDAYRDTISLVAEGDEIVPGLRVLDTPGHSPGHISLFLDDGPGLVLSGDAIIHEKVSFARPDWAFGFDTDAMLAVTSRRRLLELAASKGYAMCGGHWSWPGVGFAERDGEGYKFIPMTA